MNLAERNRAVNTRIFVDGMSLREISDKYAIPLGTVQHRYMRGKRKLQELIRDDNLHNDASRLEIAYGSGKRFLQAAIDKNISLSEVSRRSGVGRTTLFGFIYDGRDLSSLRLAKICGVVGVSMDYVMGLKR